MVHSDAPQEMHQGLLETKFTVITFMITFKILYFTGNATIYKDITPIGSHTTASKSQKNTENGRDLGL